MARAFARHGMAVVLCDIQAERLAAAQAEVQGLGARAVAVATDVSDRASVEQAAHAALDAFGAIHVVCNNAGVTMHGKSVADLTRQEWEWLIGVNLYGVIHGIQVFLPLIQAHGEEGHIVNTASIAGFQVRPGRRSGAYAATKYAVVALSESLAQDLEGTQIGVSVLAPAAVNTQIYRSGANRPARFGGPFTPSGHDRLQEELRHGLDPDVVGERVVRAIRGGEFFVFTHTEPRAWLEERHRRIMNAFAECERWRAELGSVSA
jgi:NAD(P)-dependent dehydrogenase (short-subunit alcohol dehydrogenase family)